MLSVEDYMGFKAGLGAVDTIPEAKGARSQALRPFSPGTARFVNVKWIENVKVSENINRGQINYQSECAGNIYLGNIYCRI
jgi:muramidase (phage lysozyme)